jgi:uncharacterized protein YjbJ (UPF0337 family)
MPWDRIMFEWSDARSLLQHRWGLLTDDDLDAIAGDRERLLSRLAAHYERPRDHLERQLSEFELRFVDAAA